MRQILCLLLALCCVAATPKLRDIVTRAGVVYTKAEVTKVTSTGISISHSDGVAFLDFYDLPVDLQKEFGYTPESYLAAKRGEIDSTIESARAASAQAEQQRAAATREAEALRLQTATIQNRNYADRGYGSSTYTDRNYSGGYAPTPTPAPSTPNYTYSGSSSGGGGGTVSVKGYFRKDGTYVHSYSRRK